MSWARGGRRARGALLLLGPRRWLAGRRGPERAANEDPEDEGAIPFSASKASPRVWSVSQSMGSDYERSWVKVLPVSLLCSGLLLWCVFRDKTEIDDKLEALFAGQMVDPSDAAQQSGAPPQLQKER
ncbi:ubiquinol-cytochrome c reductase complex assembly factor 4 [Excalfactoria chinensis]|uniref:ubiquinol-cytochrome c reductase complex assembly factor 4 n=1 Tax=Excalfactoria chinensis TaxID=46218 RepID=UPI003B3B2F47